MIRLLITGIFLLTFQSGCAQTDSIAARQEIENFRFTLNEDYRNPKESPLGPEGVSHFTGHQFFTTDLNYRVIAKVEKLKKPEKFLMQTTTDRKPEYKKLFKLTFTLKDTVCVLYAYQNVELSKREGYENYIFLPFTDPTNGFDSYGGGRYIDLRIPDTDSMVIDFNQCYNPYCAYSGKYSCPVPPKENRLPISIYAGIKAPEGH
ncbi:MAG: DUF1684 domain-containing protein [Bacteroidia bacterium]|jgi:uncharacterized protein (DUF1684 family)|nr:DUF1684 domain-containing protein [Bacteroidia bacterium]